MKKLIEGERFGVYSTLVSQHSLPNYFLLYRHAIEFEEDRAGGEEILNYSNYNNCIA